MAKGGETTEGSSIASNEESPAICALSSKNSVLLVSKYAA